MTHLKNAPLIYTRGMVRFTRLPDWGSVRESFHKLIRAVYPTAEDFTGSLLSATFSAEGVDFKEDKIEQWQFSSFDRKWGFVFSPEALYLHTADGYKDSADFLRRFQAGLEALVNVPDLGPVFLTSISLRYVDMVVSQEELRLEDLVHSWALPIQPNTAGLKMIDGANIGKYLTPYGELRLQSMRNPPFTVSPELFTPMLAKYGWLKQVPDVDFAVIDTDHELILSQPQELEVAGAIEALGKLHVVAKDIFEAFGTPKAMGIWRAE